MMARCIRCHTEETQGRVKICDDCVSQNTSRQRRPRITPKELVRGTKWRYKRIPELTGVVDAIHVGGFVNCVIPDSFGEFEYRARVEQFMQAWERVVPQSNLDLEVERHKAKTKRIPLNGQQTLLTFDET